MVNLLKNTQTSQNKKNNNVKKAVESTNEYLDSDKDNEEGENEININNVNPERYKDLEGVTLKKLKIGLWFVENRKNFLYILYGSLILISIITWPIFIYNFGYYVVKGMKEDGIVVNDLIKTTPLNHNVALSMSAQSLQHGQVKVVGLKDKKYDLAVEVKNPNDYFWCHFDYYFVHQFRYFLLVHYLSHPQLG